MIPSVFTRYRRIDKDDDNDDDIGGNDYERYNNDNFGGGIY